VSWREGGGLVVGEALAVDASPEELRFHLARGLSRPRDVPSDDPAPERAGLEASGSLGAALAGLGRDLWGRPRPRSLEERRALVRSHPGMLALVELCALRADGPEATEKPEGAAEQRRGA
jgi:hypothetical protein